MTISIPPELEQALAHRAEQRHITVDELIREALDWYLNVDSGLLDELEAWQEVRDEALRLVEEETPP
jgi:predicted transcriptional regulator